MEVSGQFHTPATLPPGKEPLVIDSFHCCGISSLFQIELVSLWILEHNVLPPFDKFYGNLINILGDLYLSNFSIAISNLKELSSGTNGSAACISVCLTLLMPCTTNS
jgi:hypothetical protein